MLIDKFTFQTDFLFYKKHTKCTLNLFSLDFPSADSSTRKTVINSSRANLPLDLLSFFLENDSLVFSSTSTFHVCISSVYFTVRRGDLFNWPKFYRASSVSWRAPTGKWQWLTDQSERAIYFCYVINFVGTQVFHCRLHGLFKRSFKTPMFYARLKIEEFSVKSVMCSFKKSIYTHPPPTRGRHVCFRPIPWHFCNFLTYLGTPCMERTSP